uniref:E3 ubiquitin-protein ligase n=1 Tax=Bursaphelenchus xylophilus TaxID=6326 RepID=A0A1I7SJB2_BURXY
LFLGIHTNSVSRNRNDRPGPAHVGMRASPERRWTGRRPMPRILEMHQPSHLELQQPVAPGGRRVTAEGRSGPKNRSQTNGFLDLLDYDQKELGAQFNCDGRIMYDCLRYISSLDVEETINHPRCSLSSLPTTDGVKERSKYVKKNKK